MEKIHEFTKLLLGKHSIMMCGFHRRKALHAKYVYSLLAKIEPTDPMAMWGEGQLGWTFTVKTKYTSLFA